MICGRSKIVRKCSRQSAFCRTRPQSSWRAERWRSRTVEPARGRRADSNGLWTKRFERDERATLVRAPNMLVSSRRPATVRVRRCRANRRPAKRSPATCRLRSTAPDRPDHATKSRWRPWPSRRFAFAIRSAAVQTVAVCEQIDSSRDHRCWRQNRTIRSIDRCSYIDVRSFVEDERPTVQRHVHFDSTVDFVAAEDVAVGHDSLVEMRRVERKHSSIVPVCCTYRSAFHSSARRSVLPKTMSSTAVRDQCRMMLEKLTTRCPTRWTIQRHRPDDRVRCNFVLENLVDKCTDIGWPGRCSWLRFDTDWLHSRLRFVHNDVHRSRASIRTETNRMCSHNDECCRPHKCRPGRLRIRRYLRQIKMNKKSSYCRRSRSEMFARQSVRTLFASITFHAGRTVALVAVQQIDAFAVVSTRIHGTFVHVALTAIAGPAGRAFALEIAAVQSHATAAVQARIRDAGVQHRFTVDAGVAGPTATAILIRSDVLAHAAVHARPMGGAKVKILITQHSAPIAITHTLERLHTVSVGTARMFDAFGAIRPLKAGPTLALIRTSAVSVLSWTAGPTDRSIAVGPFPAGQTYRFAGRLVATKVTVRIVSSSTEFAALVTEVVIGTAHSKAKHKTRQDGAKRLVLPRECVVRRQTCRQHVLIKMYVFVDHIQFGSLFVQPRNWDDQSDRFLLQ